MPIGKTPSGADPVLQHTPEACKRIEVVTTVGRQAMQPQLLVPVCQRRRELFRPVDATAVGDHDHLFASVAKKGHHLMDIVAQPLRIKMGDGSGPDGLAKKDGAKALSGAESVDTATTSLDKPSRTKNLIIE